MYFDDCTRTTHIFYGGKWLPVVNDFGWVNQTQPNIPVPIPQCEYCGTKLIGLANCINCGAPN